MISGWGLGSDTSQVGIISQDRYDTIRSLGRPEISGDSEKKPKEISLSLVGAAKMKPTEDDPIRALVLTGEDVERLTTADWNVILTDYTEIVFARTTPEQKMLIVEETKKRGDNIVAVVRALYFDLYNLLSFNYTGCRLVMESTMPQL